MPMDRYIAVSERMSKILPVTSTSNCLGAHQLHGRVVDIQFQGNVGASPAKPETISARAATLDVGLVHRRDPAPTLARQFKGQPGDAFNLRLAVDVGVETFLLTVIQGANTPGFASQMPFRPTIRMSKPATNSAFRLKPLPVEEREWQAAGRNRSRSARIANKPRSGRLCAQAIPLGATHGAQQAASATLALAWVLSG